MRKLVSLISMSLCSQLHASYELLLYQSGISNARRHLCPSTCLCNGFPSLGGPGPDFLILGPGQILYQIFTQGVSPSSFPSLGVPGLDFFIPGPGQIL
jgi:hypothetical protein